MKRKAEEPLTPQNMAENSSNALKKSKNTLQEPLLKTFDNPITSQTPKKKMIQLSIGNFTTEKIQDEKPFVPIDRVSSPKMISKRGRGRPRKYEVTPAKILKSEEKASLKVEVLPEKDSEQIFNEEQKEQEDVAEKRPPYQRIPHSVKLKILENFVTFEKNPPVKDGKRQSFDDFCHEQGDKLNVNWSTVKSLCRSYKKNPQILTQLQILCSTVRGAAEIGQINSRKPLLTYSQEIDLELADWIYGSFELGYILDREEIKDKAKELILDQNKEFKASDPWLDCFLRRHNLSLRKLNEKSKQQVDYLENLSTKLKNSAKELIKTFKIKKELVINMDESAFFWEYIPRKVVTPKMSRSCFGWKKGFHNYRSTLILAAAASGHFLRPSLILKRKSAYFLKSDNDISLHIANSENGWVNESIIIEWIEKILIPYVKDQHCLLIWDTYEAHKSSKILTYLSKYQNIHPVCIIGGRTSVDQPLDLTINKKFKNVCKKASIKHTNTLLKYMEEANTREQLYPPPKETLIQSTFLFLSFIYILVNKQTIMAEKDYKRVSKTRQISLTTLMAKITPEDIYSWIKEAYIQLKDDTNLIQKAFKLSGFIEDTTFTNNNNALEEILNHISQLEVEEAELQFVPLEDNEEDFLEGENVEINGQGDKDFLNSFQDSISKEQNKSSFFFLACLNNIRT